MIILGIDPGFGRMGYGVIEATGPETRYITAGCIETLKNTPVHERIEKIYDELAIIIKTEHPHTLAIEKLFFSKNTKTALQVAETRGVILLLAQKNNLRIREFAPMEVKIATTGYGLAQKSQIQYMVASILKMPVAPASDDAADALAVALTAAARRITELA